MNLAHVHLVLNHIPIIALPVTLIFLLFAFKSRDLGLRRFSYLMIALIALLTIPVYLTGEGAEHVAEQLPGVTEAAIEAHEEAATISLVLTLVAGAVSFAAIFIEKMNPTLVRSAVLLFTTIAVISLMVTANLGGQVRHTEIRPENPASESQAELNQESYGN